MRHKEKCRNDAKDAQQTRRPPAPLRIHFSHRVLRSFFRLFDQAIAIGLGESAISRRLTQIKLDIRNELLIQSAVVLPYASLWCRYHTMFLFVAILASASPKPALGRIIF